MPASHDNRVAEFAGYCLGQLRALRADHRACLEFADVLGQLPRRAIRRGHSDGEDWLAAINARKREDLPDYLARRGSTALTAAAYGDLEIFDHTAQRSNT